MLILQSRSINKFLVLYNFILLLIVILLGIPIVYKDFEDLD